MSLIIIIIIIIIIYDNRWLFAVVAYASDDNPAFFQRIVGRCGSTSRRKKTLNITQI